MSMRWELICPPTLEKQFLFLILSKCGNVHAKGQKGNTHPRVVEISVKDNKLIFSHLYK